MVDDRLPGAGLVRQSVTDLMNRIESVEALVRRLVSFERALACDR